MAVMESKYVQIKFIYKIMIVILYITFIFSKSAYPTAGGVSGLYGPVKIDLGGVLLGSLIGLGAVLILPKLVHAFSYSYGGGYGRSK